MSNDFVLDWEKALGYRGDPFADKVMEPAGEFIVDRTIEKEKINWFFIKGYFYGSVLGEHGVGKTTLLKWLEERLRKYNKIHCIYINAAVFREQINIQHQILVPLLSVYEKMWTKPHQKVMGFNYVEFLKKKLGRKSVALLIDNGHNLTDKNLELLRSLREEGLRIQVITATTQSDYERSNLQEFGTDDLGISLRRLNFEEAKEMMVKRIQFYGGRGIAPFTEERLRFLFERADKNPRQFIHLCRDDAIKILLQRKGAMQNPLMEEISTDPKPHIAAMKPGKKRPEIRHDFRQQQSTPVHTPSNQHEQHQAPKQSAGWKSPIRFKLDMRKGKTHAAVNNHVPTTPQFPIPQQVVHDKKKLFSSDKYSQDLLNRLSSAKPKKKQPEQHADFDDFFK